MESTIRPYQDSDEADVVRLSLRAWAPVHDSLRAVMGVELFEGLYGDDWRRQQQRDVEGALRDEEMQVWVAEDGGQAVGFVAATLRTDDGVGEVHMVAVDPDAQNRGLGTELTRVATDWIRNAGLPVAVISTGGDVGHAPARRAYEKAGYTAVPSVNFFKVL